MIKCSNNEWSGNESKKHNRYKFELRDCSIERASVKSAVLALRWTSAIAGLITILIANHLSISKSAIVILSAWILHECRVCIWIVSTVDNQGILFLSSVNFACLSNSWITIESECSIVWTEGDESAENTSFYTISWNICSYRYILKISWYIKLSHSWRLNLKLWRPGE